MRSRRWSPEKFLATYGKHFECRGSSLFWVISPTNSIPAGTIVGRLAGKLKDMVDKLNLERYEQ